MSEPVHFVLEGHHYVLVRGDRHEDRSPDFQPVSAWEAGRVLARALDRADARSRLREGLGVLLTTSGWEEHGGFSRRLEALLAGPERLVLLQRPHSLRASILTEAPADDLSGASETGEVVDQAWVEVLVVDDEDNPCANIEYEIELSDGRVRRGRTNDSGILRYENIPDGSCKVRLPKLDAEVWNLA